MITLKLEITQVGKEDGDKKVHFALDQSWAGEETATRLEKGFAMFYSAIMKRAGIALMLGQEGSAAIEGLHIEEQVATLKKRLGI